MKHAAWLGGIALLGLLLTTGSASGQSGSSAGRDFLLAFLPNVAGPGGPTVEPQLVELHLSAEAPVDVTVEWPAVAPTLRVTTSIVPGEITRVELPAAASQSWVSDAVQDKAVRLVAAEPFTVYMVNLVVYSSDAALGIPIEGMGQDYLIVSYGQSFGNEGSFAVVASENDTTVTITPAQDLLGHAAGVPYTLQLQAGEAYLGPPSFAGDATGTLVASDKPVGVTNGVQCAWVPTGLQACDHIFEVAQPTTTWGSRFVLANLPDRPRGTVYRILAAHDDTRIELDGVFLTDLQRGGFHELPPLGGDHLLESDKPTFVSQYMTARESPGATTGDPALGNVIPIDQFLPAYTFSTVGGDRYEQHHLVVTLRDEDLGTATLDGALLPAASFTPVAGSGYSVARLPISEGVHRTESSHPHSVMVLGYNQFDSYLFPAGARLLNLECIDFDLTPPRVDDIAPDAVVPCDEVPPPGEPTVSDNCDPPPTLEFSETRTDGPCPDRYSLLREWTAIDGFGLETTASRRLEVVDELPPSISGVPADEELSCADELELPAVSAEDDCDPAPTVELDELRLDGPCEDSYTLTRTWTATDRCGNSASEVQVIELSDDLAPTLLGVPEDAIAACDEVPPIATPTAEDDCDPAPLVEASEIRIDGPCPDRYRLRREWTATDRCGNQSRSLQVLDVVDDEAPSLFGVPADRVVSCDSVPPPADVNAVDGCDPAPRVDHAETRVDGPCPDRYLLRREWTGTDRCGNVRSALQELEVIDDRPPLLLGVPADRVVECDSVPPPAPVTARDDCDPEPVLSFVEQREDGDCPGRYVLTRTWTAEDRCGNRETAQSRIEVVDTTPPSVEESEAIQHCLWPPNHRFVCFSQADFAPSLSDNCSEPVSWRFAGCDSDQPDDDLGDGSTEGDCIVAADGLGFCARAERQGGERSGRRYRIRIVAADACGNESSAVTIATVWVPHDRSEHPAGCLKARSSGPASD